VAVARALAPPPVSAEWCLPLVQPGGVAIVYAGAAVTDLSAASSALGASAPDEIAVAGSDVRRLLVFRKLQPTPERFPRRPGVARKRPLA